MILYSFQDERTVAGTSVAVARRIRASESREKLRLESRVTGKQVEK